MMRPDPSQTDEISPQQWLAWSEDPSIRLIDCREADEWNFNRLEGAVHMPLSLFLEQATALLEEPERTTVIYCHHGVRSLHATYWLRQQGMKSVFSMAGGIDRWSLEIDPLLPRY